MTPAVMIAAVVISVAVSPAAVTRDADQRTTAVVSGAVLDPDGVPVVDSVVFLTQVESGTQLQFVTSTDGRFEFSGLAPGLYRLTSMTSGFGRIELPLEAGDTIRRDVVLQLGPFQEAWLIGVSARDRASAQRRVGTRLAMFVARVAFLRPFVARR